MSETRKTINIIFIKLLNYYMTDSYYYLSTSVLDYLD